MLMSLCARKKQFNINERRLILLIGWYIKYWTRQENKRRRWWIRPINQRRNEQGDGKQLINEMRFLDAESHFKYCRMTIDVFDELLSIVGPTIQKTLTTFRKPICPRTRLYLSLR